MSLKSCCWFRDSFGASFLRFFLFSCSMFRSLVVPQNRTHFHSPLFFRKLEPPHIFPTLCYNSILCLCVCIPALISFGEQSDHWILVSSPLQSLSPLSEHLSTDSNCHQEESRKRIRRSGLRHRQRMQSSPSVVMLLQVTTLITILLPVVSCSWDQWWTYEGISGKTIIFVPKYIPLSPLMMMRLTDQ